MKKKNKKNMVLVTAEGREKSRPPGQLDSEYIHTCKAVVIIQGRVFRDKATPRYFVLWVAVADFFIVGGGWIGGNGSDGSDEQCNDVEMHVGIMCWLIEGSDGC